MAFDKSFAFCKEWRTMNAGAREILAKFGETLPEIADAIGVPAGTVGAWRSRGTIPSKRWTLLVDVARDRKIRGVTLEALADAHRDRAEAA